MKKNEITRADIKRLYDKVYRAGYCDLQNIFKYQSRRFYNSGVYGWNFDVYTEYTENGESVAITTGYRNMIGERIPLELLEKYDKAARAIIENVFSKSYEDIEKALDENRRAFIAELTA